MNFADLIITIVALAAMNAALVVLVCKSHAFAAVRTRFEGRWLGRLLACPYCTSWWTGGLLCVFAGQSQHPYIIGLLLIMGVVTLTAPFYTLLISAYGGE